MTRPSSLCQSSRVKRRPKVCSCAQPVGVLCGHQRRTESLTTDAGGTFAGRNGAKDPVINYQMVVADLTSSSAAAFGPPDYLPDTWLADGRIVATHQCIASEWGGHRATAASTAPTSSARTAPHTRSSSSLRMGRA